jgi:hypothetical protein
VTAADLLDEARALLDPAHLAAVADVLRQAGWDGSDAADAASDVLAASLVVAAEDDD